MPDSDAWDDELVADEDDGEEPVLACPNCRRSVHEDTQQCPYCGDWITSVEPGGGSKRWLWGVAVALVIVSLLFATAF